MKKTKPGIMIEYLNCYFIAIFSVNFILRRFPLHTFRLISQRFSYYISCYWTEITTKTGMVYIFEFRWNILILLNFPLSLQFFVLFIKLAIQAEIFNRILFSAVRVSHCMPVVVFWLLCPMLCFAGKRHVFLFGKTC